MRYKYVSSRVVEEEYNRIELRARVENVSISDLIRRSLKDYINRVEKTEQEKAAT